MNAPRVLDRLTYVSDCSLQDLVGPWVHEARIGCDYRSNIGVLDDHDVTIRMNLEGQQARTLG